MATPRRIAANARNALLSTGPRTLEGKRTSSLNAVKHGLTSREVLLHTEDPEEFNAFAARLREEAAPVGILEISLVERIAATLWRLKRVVRMETGTLAQHLERKIADRAHESMERMQELAENPDRLPDREEALALLAEGKRGIEALKRLTGPEFALSSAFAKAVGEERSTIDALHRYETRLERSLFRTLHELQRLQAARNGGKVLPPISVDVTV